MRQQRFVLILGHVCRWEDKAPFVRSGRSVLGAIEFRRNDDREEIRCHECGGWFQHVGQHLRAAHPGISARDYKIKHGLLLRTALAVPGISEHHRRTMLSTIKAGRAHKARIGTAGLSAESRRRAAEARSRRKDEYRNVVGRCAAQLVAYVQKLANELGRTPTGKELGSVQSDAHRRGITLPELQRMAGLNPAKTVYTREILIEAMRDFYVRNQRLPSGRDYRCMALPSAAAYHRCFGSMGKAYEAAGLALKMDPSAMQKRTAGCTKGRVPKLSPLAVAV